MHACIHTYTHTHIYIHTYVTYILTASWTALKFFLLLFTTKKSAQVHNKECYEQAKKNKCTDYVHEMDIFMDEGIHTHVFSDPVFKRRKEKTQDQTKKCACIAVQMWKSERGGGEREPACACACVCVCICVFVHSCEMWGLPCPKQSSVSMYACSMCACVLHSAREHQINTRCSWELFLLIVGENAVDSAKRLPTNYFTANALDGPGMGSTCDMKEWVWQCDMMCREKKPEIALTFLLAYFLRAWKRRLSLFALLACPALLLPHEASRPPEVSLNRGALASNQRRMMSPSGVQRPASRCVQILTTCFSFYCLFSSAVSKAINGCREKLCMDQHVVMLWMLWAPPSSVDLYTRSCQCLIRTCSFQRQLKPPPRGRGVAVTGPWHMVGS